MIRALLQSLLLAFASLGLVVVAQKLSGWTFLSDDPETISASHTPPRRSVDLNNCTSNVLGVYFRSWIDLIVPTVIWLALIAILEDAGFWIGAVIGGVFGLLRVSGWPREPSDSL